MACNTPIIAAFDTDSELAELLNASGAGISVEPEDADALAEAIRRAKEMKKDILNASSPRGYVCENASSAVCTGKYIDEIKSCVDR